MPADTLVVGSYDQELAEIERGQRGEAVARSKVRDGLGHRWQADDALQVGIAGETVQLVRELRPPVGEITCIFLAQDGDRWFGTPRGAMRLSGGRWRYYAGRRWLPDDEVLAIAPHPAGGVCIHTRTGRSRIFTRQMTLADKASLFEQQVAARHNRYGFVTSCRLESPEDLDAYVHEASDNDGLWTALYVAAEAFRYAVTGEPEARALARKSLHALMMLEEKSTITGFPARAIVSVGEQRVIKSGG
ncbi:MAG: hypothetical protein ACE5O2_08170, partial [Armatimonadota bacterium]